MRPGVGFNPQMPEKCAGTRMEPPPSLPIPPAEQHAAIAAASPPLEPPGRTFQVPWTVRRSIKRVTGLPRHQEFRNRRVAEDYRACGFQSRDERRVRRSDIALPQPSAGLTEQTLHVDATLYRDGHAMQRADRLAGGNCFVRKFRLRSCAVFIDGDECMELRLEVVDQAKMRINHFLR